MIDIFIAYSHEDLRYKDELKKFLRPLLNTSQARVWDDYDIEAGKDWEAEIKTKLYGADIILLLVSPDSLASDYFYGKEVAVSLERHEKGEAVVAPVILRPCAWTITPLKKIEAMPEKGKPITSWASQDEAFTDVAHRLGEIVARLQADHDARGKQAEDRRRFDAIVDAATHLFDKNNWSESLKAYTQALGMYQSGYTPDAATLRKQISACEQNKQQELENQAFADRRTAFEKVLEQAGVLFAQENWSESLVAYKAAQVLLEPDFGSTDANSIIRERMAACETALREAKEKSRMKNKPLVPEATPSATQSSNRLVLWVGVGVVVLLIVLVAAFRPWARKNSPGSGSDFGKKTEERISGDKPPNLTPLEQNSPDYLFQNAKTIPELTIFLQQFPSDKNAPEAKRRLDGLEKNRTAWLVTAALNLEDKDFANARKYYEKVLTIDPKNVEALKKLEKIKGK